MNRRDFILHASATIGVLTVTPGIPTIASRASRTVASGKGGGGGYIARGWNQPSPRELSRPGDIENGANVLLHTLLALDHTL
jgi:hypothetical protein